MRQRMRLSGTEGTVGWGWSVVAQTSQLRQSKQSTEAVPGPSSEILGISPRGGAGSSRGHTLCSGREERSGRGGNASIFPPSYGDKEEGLLSKVLVP